jgi:hypothetical protein
MTIVNGLLNGRILGHKWENASACSRLWPCQINVVAVGLFWSASCMFKDIELHPANGRDQSEN